MAVVSPPRISTSHYLLDPGPSGPTPTLNTIPAWAPSKGAPRDHDWRQYALAEPPAGSGLKTVMGDSGLPIVGHMIETFRGGPDYSM